MVRRCASGCVDILFDSLEVWSSGILAGGYPSAQQKSLPGEDHFEGQEGGAREKEGQPARGGGQPAGPRGRLRAR